MDASRRTLAATRAVPGQGRNLQADSAASIGPVPQPGTPAAPKAPDTAGACRPRNVGVPGSEVFPGDISHRVQIGCLVRDDALEPRVLLLEPPPLWASDSYRFRTSSPGAGHPLIDGERNRPTRRAKPPDVGTPLDKLQSAPSLPGSIMPQETSTSARRQATANAMDLDPTDRLTHLVPMWPLDKLVCTAANARVQCFIGWFL